MKNTSERLAEKEALEISSDPKDSQRTPCERKTKIISEVEEIGSAQLINDVRSQEVVTGVSKGPRRPVSVVKFDGTGNLQTWQMINLK